MGDGESAGTGLSKDFYYSAQALKRKQPYKYEIPKSSYALHHCFGVQSTRRNNILYIDVDMLIYAAGNAVIVQNMKTNERKYIFGYDGQGIGAVCVHPSKKYFAVGEKGDNPNVYIYEYPSYKIHRVCRKGTEKAYSCLKFSPDGEKLATVGAYPDFLLTVWDWQDERIILHTKAFSQEVFNVSFSPDDPGVLHTSGTGHIRFWKMAATFTGLKLQGDIGKFGKVELSDVDAYAALPDGKVLSSTENGSLLLWDGNFIKCEITRPKGVKCHDGGITCVILERENKHFITAGEDGYLRWWDMATVDAADTTDEMPIFEMSPKEEKFLGEGVSVQSMEKGSDHWLIQDSNGSMIKMNEADKSTETLMQFHSRGIKALVVSPIDHFAATAGADGTIRCWDYVDKKELYSTKFPCAASCAAWAPLSLDQSAKTILVGFTNGVVRVLMRTATEWKLMQVLKPHNKCVTAVAYSPDGKSMATCGEDNTIFLFDTSKSQYEPSGFYDLGAKINSADWRGDSRAVLVACSDGIVSECPVPEANHDTSETFKLSLKCKKYTFKRPPAKKSSAEIEAAIAEALKPPPLEEEGAAEGEEEEAVEEVEVPLSAAVCAIYKDGSNDESFYVCFEGSDASSIYECDWSEEGPTAVIADSVLPTAVMAYTQSRRFIVTGSNDGIVRMRSVENQDPFLQVIAHDGVTGVINSATTSFDDQFLLSVGDDGQFFVFRIKAEEIETQAAVFEEKVKKRVEMIEAAGLLAEAKAKNDLKKTIEANAKEGAKQEPLPDPEMQKALAVAKAEEEEEDDEDDDSGFMFSLEGGDLGDQSAAPPGAPTGFEPAYSSLATDAHDQSAIDAIVVPEDIVSDEVYSIQDAKLKTEEDNRIAAAEKKKDVVRAQIEELRAEYAKLVEQNEQEIAERQLDSDAFMIEHDYFQTLIEEGEQECMEVRKELEYITEKSDRHLAKLRARFLDAVAVEYIELKALRSSYSVRSFRCDHLSRELQEDLRQVHAELVREEAARKNEADASQDAGAATGPASAGGAAAGQAAASADGSGADAGGGGAAAAQGFEARKILRQARNKKLLQLEESKPAEDAEDPRDVRAIAYAEANMGDYKLKTAADYVVPEEQRVNADKKRRQLVLLDEDMHNVQMDFNSRFLSLRDLKKQIIQQIKDDNKRVEEINKELGEEGGVLWTPEVLDSEWPEMRDVVTDADLDTHKADNGHETGGAKGGSASGGANAQDGDSAPALGFSDNETKLQAAVDAGMPEYMVHLAKAPAGGDLSDVQTGAQGAQHRRLQHEKAKLMEKTTQTVEMFDEAIYELRAEKMHLDYDLKAASMKMLTMFRELVLLRQFEAKDAGLAKKLANARTSKSAVVAEITECQTKLAAKKEEIAGWNEKAKNIINEFNALVGETNQFHPQLLKIFKKKIKRAKKRTGDEDEDEEEEEEWDDDDDEDFDDDEDEEEEEEDACPPGCDQTLYDKVLELREKRLDQEEIISDIQKTIDEHSRNVERHTQRSKQIVKDLNQTEKEIERFQTEKQERLNELDIVVSLRLDQLLCTVPKDPEDVGGEAEVLSTDVDNCLVFGRNQLNQIKARIAELGEENRTLRQQFKDLHKEQSRLTREKKGKEAEILDKKDKCEDLQMLKFGQLIDLEALDKVSVSKGVDDLREKIRVEELKNERQFQSMKDQHQQYREMLLQATLENTQLLEQIADLSQKQFKLEKELNSTGSQMHVADQGPLIKNEIEERNRLVQLVKLQAKEVDALKAEINMLRRKGGHVYTPVGNA